MNRRRIVIIGGVAAGPKAAARARRRDPRAEITIVERGRLISYAGCGLPYYVAGLVPDLHGLLSTQAGVSRDPAYFWNEKKVKVLTRTVAEEIDRGGQKVVVRNLETGERSVLSYDRLALATGSEPWVPPLEGLALTGVFKLSHPDDAVAIRQRLRSGEVRRAVIIGGGLIGLEALDAFSNVAEAVVIELGDQILPGVLDPEMAGLVRRHLTAQGAEIRTGERVLGLEGDSEGNVRRVVTDQGVVEADLVLTACGVRPNVGLARAAGLAAGPTGALAVNDHLQTSAPEIYAGGDCVENLHRVSGRRVYLPLASTANKHGRVIGDNLTGGDEVFQGVLGTVVLQVMDYNVGRTGLTEQEARELGFDVLTSKTASLDCAHYYPMHGHLVIKLIVESGSGRLLGAQTMGAGEAIKRLDVLTTAISFGATVDDVARLDLGYSPVFGTPLDSAIQAANVARNRRSGMVRGVSADEVRARLGKDDNLMLLDVRLPKEVDGRPWRGAPIQAIPLGELRQRLSELPRDREIITVCELGVRGYEAARILEGEGFQRVRYLEGGLECWPGDFKP